MERLPLVFWPDLAVKGALEDFIGAVPVYNVAQPVMGKDFWIFELGD